MKSVQLMEQLLLRHAGYKATSGRYRPNKELRLKGEDGN